MAVHERFKDHKQDSAKIPFLAVQRPGMARLRTRTNCAMLTITEEG